MNGIFVLVPIMALGIAVAAIISSAILKMQRLKLEEARLTAGNPAEIDDLAREVQGLRQELTEVQERLDFAERMLTQGRDAAVLPAPRNTPPQ